MALINDFYNSNKQKYNIFIVYITEAHAADVWPIGLSSGTINYKHKTIEDRLFCVDKMKNEYHIDVPMYADNMNDIFETEFASWPFRFYVIKNKKFKMIGQPNEAEFDICELFDFVEKL